MGHHETGLERGMQQTSGSCNDSEVMSILSKRTCMVVAAYISHEALISELRSSRDWSCSGAEWVYSSADIHVRRESAITVFGSFSAPTEVSRYARGHLVVIRISCLLKTTKIVEYAPPLDLILEGDGAIRGRLICLLKILKRLLQCTWIF
jgi:hypothetical protein